MWVPTAEAKALGLTPVQPTNDIDGYAGFSSSFAFTYDPNNRAVAGKYDFIGVVEHEFSEIMGRIDLFGYRIDGINPGYSPLDLFHYTAQGVHTYTGTTTNYFSVDGGHTNLDYFNSNPSGDLGDWAASAGADSYLAFSPYGQANWVSQADQTAMNALGYPIVQTVIEASGSTELVKQGDFFFLDPVGGGIGPEVKMSGTPIGQSQVGGWVAVGTEAVSGGYEIAWHLPGKDLYTVWNLDSSGNYLSDTIGAVTGTSATLENLETSFHQDLNGDGVTGVPTATTIESHGETALVQEGNFFFVDWIPRGTGPVVTMNGDPLSAS
jgi:hypothetical protein